MTGRTEEPTGGSQHFICTPCPQIGGVGSGHQQAGAQQETGWIGRRVETAGGTYWTRYDCVAAMTAVTVQTQFLSALTTPPLLVKCQTGKIKASGNDINHTRTQERERQREIESFAIMLSSEIKIRFINNLDGEITAVCTDLHTSLSLSLSSLALFKTYKLI